LKGDEAEDGGRDGSSGSGSDSDAGGSDMEGADRSEGKGSRGSNQGGDRGGRTRSMSLQEASSRGIRPGGGGVIGGFEGIAWWAAPSMSVIVFDQDEGLPSPLIPKPYLTPEP